MRYMLISLSILVKGTTALCGENLRIIISCTNLDSELKKKHVAILYYKLQENAAVRIVYSNKVCTMVNQSGILTKSTLVGLLGSFSNA